MSEKNCTISESPTSNYVGRIQMTERVERKIPTENTTQVKKSIACAPRSNLASSSNSDANRHLTRTSTRLKDERPPSPVPKNPIGQSENVPPDPIVKIESNTPLSGEINVPPFTKHGINLRTEDTNHQLKTSAQTTF